MKLELYIGGKKIDLFGDEPINITYSIADVREIFSRDTTFSQRFKLPSTPNNNDTFSNLFDIRANSTSFNPNQLVRAQLYRDSVILLDGWFQLLDIDIDELNKTWIYNGTLTSYIYNFYSLIKDKTLQNLSWFDQYDVSIYNPTTYFNSIKNSWTAFTSNPDTNPFVYPLIDKNQGWLYSEIQRTSPIDAISIPRCVGIKKIVDEIFRDAGYQYQSQFFESEYFKRLIMLTDNNGEMTCNYEVVLNLEFNTYTAGWEGENDYFVQIVATSDFMSGSTSRLIDEWGAKKYRQTSGQEFQQAILKGTTTIKPGEKISVRVAVPPTSFVDNTGQVSYFRNFIYCNSGSTMEFKYSFPFDDTFKFKVETQVQQHGEIGPNISPNGGGVVGATGADYMEYTINWTGPISSPPYPFPNAGYEVYPDDNDLFDEGVGIYHTAPRPILSIFLPPVIKQSEFLNWLINLFNLYIDFDRQTNKIIIEPRDEYYANNNITRDWTNILDISKPQNIKLIADTQPKNYIFSYQGDDDIVNTNYQDSYTDEVYGQYSTSLNNEILSDTSKIEVGFSPSPLVNLTGSKEIIIPKIYKEDLGESITFNPRLLYYNGLQPLPTESLYITPTYQSYNLTTTDPTAYFLALINNISLNDRTFIVNSSSIVGGTEYFIDEVDFSSEAYGSPNWSNPVFTALADGNYSFSFGLTLDASFRRSYGSATLYIKPYFSIRTGGLGAPTSQFFLGSLPINVDFATGYRTGQLPINFTISNVSMNIGDTAMIELYYTIATNGFTSTYTGTTRVNGIFYSRSNTVQLANSERFNYYPYASEFVGLLGQETESIMYGPPNTLYYNYSYDTDATYPDLGLYKKYWSNYISEIQNSDSKIYTAFFNLNEADINQFKFSDLIFVDGNYYRINKINYNATSDDTTKVELLKLERIQESLQNQNVIVARTRPTNSLSFNSVLGTNNQLNGYTSVIGNNNTLTNSSYSTLIGTNNTINGFATNVMVNGSNNTLNNDVENVLIIGNNNTINYSNSSIINGSNNYIGSTNSIVLSGASSGLTGNTSVIPSNVILLGVSNVTASTSNTVYVPNLNVQSGLTVNGIDLTSSSILIPKLQVRLLKWVDNWSNTQKCNPIYFQWYNTGDNRWQNYQPEIWLFRLKKHKRKKYILPDTTVGYTEIPTKWVHPVDYRYSANTYTTGGRNISFINGTNTINVGDTDRPLITQWEITKPELPFYPQDPTFQTNYYPANDYYYNIRTSLDWNPGAYFSVIDNNTGSLSAATPSVFPFNRTDYNIRATSGGRQSRIVNFAFAIVIRDPNNPNKVIYGPMSEIVRCSPLISDGMAPTDIKGLQLSLWDYPLRRL